MADSYLTLKAFHIIGAVLFMGNIIVTGWWKIMADRTRDPRIIAFAQRQVMLTDCLFTAVGAALILGTGLSIGALHGIDYWSTPWIAWGLGVFVVSGVIWGFILIPIQVRQARMTRYFAMDTQVPDEYWRLGRLWALFGAVAVVLPLITVYWMVYKPA